MRLNSIDMLRGIAILGILIMNISYHNNILTGYVHFEQPLFSDQIIIFLQSLFADGRFRSLFCLMFGAGMAIQYEWCQREGANHVDFLKSRMHWLLVFGLVHITFLFGGDILVIYSLCGLMLIKRLSFDQQTTYKKGVKHLIIGSCLIALLGAIFLISDLDAEVIHRSSPEFLEMVSDWHQGYHYQVIYQIVILIVVFVCAYLFIVWQPLGLMLLGVYLYRRGFFSTGFDPQTFNKLFVISIISSLITASPAFLPAQVDPTEIMMFSSISAIFVALVYAHIVIKICNNRQWLIDALSACGKLAFTLYLGQSIVMVLLFRVLIPEIHPDFDTSVTMLDFMSITLVFSAIQLIFAKWYIDNISQRGPFEYLWRKCFMQSYQKKVCQTE